MSIVKSAIVCGLVALIVSGCGIAAKPRAGSLNASSLTGLLGAANAGRAVPMGCLQQNHLPAVPYRTAQNMPAIRVGSGPSAPTMVFEPTIYYAEGLKITGQAQGAELIGAVLLYPNGASLSEAKIVEGCAATAPMPQG